MKTLLRTLLGGAALLLLVSLTSHAQAVPAPVWATITPESYTVSVALPAGATYRLGDYTNNKWSDPTTVTAATTIAPVRWPYGFTFADPDPGFVKELDVLETSAAQTVTVTDSALLPATVTAKQVPALPPPPAHKITISSIRQTVGSSSATYFFNLADFPPSLAAAVANGGKAISESFTGNEAVFIVDGVYWVCEYQPDYVVGTGVYSWSCPVPAPPTQAAQ